MGATKRDSSSLTARQRARRAQAEEADRLKRREGALVGVFSAQDECDAAERKLGRAIAELLRFGESRPSAAALTGMSAREIGRLVALVEKPDEDSNSAAQDSSDTDAAPADAGGGGVSAAG